MCVYYRMLRLFFRSKWKWCFVTATLVLIMLSLGILILETRSSILALTSTTAQVTRAMKAAGREKPPVLRQLSEIPTIISCAVMKQIVDTADGFTNTESEVLQDRTLSSTLANRAVASLFAGGPTTLREQLLNPAISLISSRIVSDAKLLESYLNHARLGASVWGVQEGSRRFFAKPVDQLTPAQALFLAAIVTSSSPNPAEKLTEQDARKLSGEYLSLVERLTRSGVIDREDATILRQELARVIGQIALTPGTTPKDTHFLSTTPDKLSVSFTVFNTHFSPDSLDRCHPDFERALLLVRDAQKIPPEILEEPPPINSISLHNAIEHTASTVGPEFISASPQQDHFLLKNPKKGGVELLVLDRVSQRIIARQGGGLRASHPTWSPQGERIAFALRTDLHRYAITIWDIARDTTQNLKHVSSSAPPELVWSPQGDRIAFSYTPKTDAPAELRVISTLGKDEKLIGQIRRGTKFDWLPDASAVAYIPEGNPGSIETVVLSEPPQRTTTTVVNGECYSLAVKSSPSLSRAPGVAGDGKSPATRHFLRPELAASCRERGAEFAEIFLVQVTPHKIFKVSAKDLNALGDFLNPTWDFLGRHLYFIHREGGENNLVAFKKAGEGISRSTRREDQIAAFPYRGTSSLFRRSSQSPLVIWSDQSHPPRIIEWSPTERLAVTHERLIAPSTLAPIPVKTLVLTTADSQQIVAYHWPNHARLMVTPQTRPIAPPSRRGVIVIHSGAHTQISNVWNVAHQTISRFGADVLALNYRGSTGRGASFERSATTHARRLHDIFAAWDYMQGVLNIPQQNISIVGIGYGAQLAIDSVTQEIDSKRVTPRGVVLISPNFSDQHALISGKQTPYLGSVTVVRGGWDSSSEQPIRSYLDKKVIRPAAPHLLARSLSPNQLTWRTLYLEGAGFQTLLGLETSVYEALVASGVPSDLNLLAP